MTIGQLREQFDNFLEEAHRLKRHYASKIEIIVGAETEYISEVDAERLERLLNERGRVGSYTVGQTDRPSIEFLVGSIHHVNQIPIDFDITTYEKALRSFSSSDRCRIDSDTLAASTNDPNFNNKQRLIGFLNSYLDAQYRLLVGK